MMINQKMMMMQAMQLMGEAGMVRGSGVERNYRDARWEIYSMMTTMTIRTMMAMVNMMMMRRMRNIIIAHNTIRLYCMLESESCIAPLAKYGHIDIWACEKNMAKWGIP